MDSPGGKVTHGHGGRRGGRSAPREDRSRRRAVVPDRASERDLVARYGSVAGMDEVGRGALAGPVSVGVAVVDASSGDDLPAGLRDSKLLSPARRQALVEPVQAWVVDWAVAHASPAEIDDLGIVGALRLAGRRALAELAGRAVVPGVVLLDGSHDWLSEPDEDLFTGLIGAGGTGAAGDPTPRRGEVCRRPGATTSSLTCADLVTPPVVTRVKADATCAVVAAASVLAKVRRDTIMEELEDPGYGWASNKGYASAAHTAALARLGASGQHRRSWRLPGVAC